MRTTRTILAVLALAVLAGAGCTAHTTTRPPAAPTPAASTPTPTSPAGSSPTPTITPTPPLNPSPSDGTAWPTGTRVTAATSPSTDLVAIRSAEHATFDRVVFQFRSRAPGYDIRYLDAVREDPTGYGLPLRGRAFLRVVFRHASLAEQGISAPPYYSGAFDGAATATPTGMSSLKDLRKAGDFEGYLSFGAGLDHRVGFRVLTLTDPSRVVLDVARSRAPTPPFPGIWDINTWDQAFELQAALDNGHQPWRCSAAGLVARYAQQVLLAGSAPPIVQQVGPHTFQVRKPDAGLVATVRLAQPINQGPCGLWVITGVDRNG